MRSLFLLSLCVCLTCGCANHRADPAPPVADSGSDGSTPKPVVTPDGALIGEVYRVNATAKIVVLRFPIGRMAAVEQRLNVYRNGLKVGEVIVTGPPRDDMIAGDLVAGDAREGDVIRSN